MIDGSGALVPGRRRAARHDDRGDGTTTPGEPSRPSTLRRSKVLPPILVRTRKTFGPWTGGVGRAAPHEGMIIRLVHLASLGAARWVRSGRPFPPSSRGLPPRRWVRSALTGRVVVCSWSRPRNDGPSSGASTTSPRPPRAISTAAFGSVGVAISAVGHGTCASMLGSLGATAWGPLGAAVEGPLLALGRSGNPLASPMPIFMNRGAAQRHGGSVGAPHWVRSARLFPPSLSGLPPRHWLRSVRRVGFARRVGWLGKSPRACRTMPSRNHEEWRACRHPTGRLIRRDDIGSPTARLASGTGLTLIRIADELRPFAPWFIIGPATSDVLEFPAFGGFGRLTSEGWGTVVSGRTTRPALAGSARVEVRESSCAGDRAGVAGENEICPGHPCRNTYQT